MAKFTCRLSKKSAKMKAASPGVKAVGTEAVIQNNEDGSLTVFGADATGATVDISAVATLAVTSSDPSYVTVGTPSGMTCTFSGVKATDPSIPVSFSIIATWNDSAAGIGPFSMFLPVTVKTGPVTGLIVDLGTPTPR